jgi:predicted Zn-dependent peptidase
MKKVIKNFGVEFDEVSLVNEVKLYSFYKPNSPIYFRVYFYAGSQYDGEKPGLAHFCEHMMVSGTEKYPTKTILNEKFEEIGARKNAFTYFKNLWFTVDLADKADLPGMFEIIDEILNKSIFSPDIIEKERGAILAEQTQKTSNPSQEISDMQSRLLFQGTNIENPVLGSNESVKTITRDDLVKYREEYLTNGHVAYFISGDFDQEIVIEALNKINNKRQPITNTEILLPTVTIKKEVTKNLSSPEQNYISLVTRIKPPENIVDIISGDIFSSIFGQGGISRLNKKLRYDRGLVYGAFAGITNSFEYAQLGISTNCKINDTKEVIKLIKFELGRIILEGINQNELEQAKKNILRDLKFKSETAEFWVQTGMMKKLSSQLNYTLPDEYVEILKSVTVENVNSFIKKYVADKELLLAGIGDFSFIKN